MKGGTYVRLLFALTITLGIGGGLSSGCAKRETTEMTQQRSEMTQDHQAWNADLQSWDTADSQLRAVMTAPPTSGAKADTSGMSDRLARLSSHEQAITQFRQELGDLDSKLANEQAADHAALWAEHQKLQGEYDQLKSEHNQLVAELGGMPDSTMGRVDTTASRY